MGRLSPSFLLLLALVGCRADQPTAPADGATDPGDAVTEPGEPDPEPDPDDGPLEFDGVDALVRASLDLRGVRPTVEEMDAVEADPGRYDSYVDAFLEDERLGQRVRDLWSEIYLTRQDYFYVAAAEFGLDDEVGFAASVGEEPLHILSEIVVQDLPYTDIVTADWTMANPTLAQAYPVDYPADGTDWEVASYTDSRPAAGVLATNGMWWRYQTNDSNANRSRANAISKIFLCNDYLSKPIEFDRNVNLLDSDALNDALQSNPGCVACHHTLDPLASFLYGFNYYRYDSKSELSYYHPEREGEWEDATGVAPGYFGEPGYSLRDLGQSMAGDPRLLSCISEQAFERFLARAPQVSDTNVINAHREVLLDSELRIKPLFRSVLTSDEYKTGVDATGQAHPKMLRPEQLGAVIEDLTGFRFMNDGYDLLGSDAYGVRTLAGGVDGVYATQAATEPTATIMLVHERIAQAAASSVVEHDVAQPGDAYLFDQISFHETPGGSDAEAMAVQLQSLHWRLYGNRIALDGPEVEANLALWEDLYQIEADKQAAWVGVLTVLLRDPEFLYY